MTSSVTGKPWPLYLMALWSFLGLGGFLASISRVLFSDNQQVLQITSIGVMVGAIYLAYLLVKFNKNGLIIFAGLSAALAAFQLLNIFKILLSQGADPIIYLLLYYVVPSTILCWLALSKKYRELSEQYTAHLKQEAMHKASTKAMRQ